ncbi:MAG: hypothetical protein MCSN_0890 [Candidatus Microsyncoccus archaeolyticus]|nr:MAG: hypothetical protein MCSN_0890 [Candidatus Parcubacteria bacterium]
MGKRSFTLIEILVVIVVIGILSSFILVGMSSITNNANIAKSKAFSDSLRNSLLTNLVSEWKLDGNGSDSWGSNTGTNGGSTFQSSGCVSNGCLNFDGTDDYFVVNDSDSLDIVNNFSIEFWYYKTSNTVSCVTGDNRILLMKANDYWDDDYYGIWVTCGDLDYFRYSTRKADVDSLGSYNANLGLNNWNHIVFTKNNTIGFFYINGIKVSQATVYAELNITAENLYAMGNSAASRTTPGMLDEIRIYNEAVSSFRIQQNYYIGINKLYKNNGIILSELNQKLSELKNNLIQK